MSEGLSDILSTPLNQASAADQEPYPFADTTDDEADNDDHGDNDDNSDNAEPWDELEVTEDIRQRLLPTRQENDAETMEVLSPSMLRVRPVLHVCMQT